MRHYRFTGRDPLVVTAAHSRVIAPGELVDFDEVVKPRDGAAYSLEVAVGGDGRFEPVADVAEATAEGGAAAATTEPAAPAKPVKPKRERKPKPATPKPAAAAAPPPAKPKRERAKK